MKERRSYEKESLLKGDRHVSDSPKKDDPKVKGFRRYLTCGTLLVVIVTIFQIAVLVGIIYGGHKIHEYLYIDMNYKGHLRWLNEWFGGCTWFTARCKEIDMEQPAPDCCRKKIIELVHWAGDYFDKHGIAYALEGGSMIGAMREGGFIMHDHDADLAVFLRTEEDHKWMHDTFLQGKPGAIPDGDGRCVAGRPLSPHWGCLAVYYTCPNRNLVDLFFYNVTDDGYITKSITGHSSDGLGGWPVLTRTAARNRTLEVEHVFPLKKCLYEGKAMNCMKNPIIYQNMWAWKPGLKFVTAKDLMVSKTKIGGGDKDIANPTDWMPRMKEMQAQGYHTLLDDRSPSQPPDRWRHVWQSSQCLTRHECRGKCVAAHGLTEPEGKGCRYWRNNKSVFACTTAKDANGRDFCEWEYKYKTEDSIFGIRNTFKTPKKKPPKKKWDNKKTFSKNKSKKSYKGGIG